MGRRALDAVVFRLESANEWTLDRMQQSTVDGGGCGEDEAVGRCRYDCCERE
jgi:hypothetical protein